MTTNRIIVTLVVLLSSMLTAAAQYTDFPDHKEILSFEQDAKAVKALKKSSVEILSAAESEAILRGIEGSEPEFLPYYALRLFAGLRASEAGKMRWEWIDFEKKTIRVPGSAQCSAAYLRDDASCVDARRRENLPCYAPYQHRDVPLALSRRKSNSGRGACVLVVAAEKTLSAGLFRCCRSERERCPACAFVDDFQDAKACRSRRENTHVAQPNRIAASDARNACERKRNTRLRCRDFGVPAEISVHFRAIKNRAGFELRSRAGGKLRIDAEVGEKNFVIFFKHLENILKKCRRRRFITRRRRLTTL